MKNETIILFIKYQRQRLQKYKKKTLIDTIIQLTLGLQMSQLYKELEKTKKIQRK